MVSEDDFDFDANWPPKSSRRPWTPYSRKEDRLLVSYLVDSGTFRHLGGMAVWQKLASSKKYNPCGRSPYSLSERFRRRLKHRLEMFVTSDQARMFRDPDQTERSVLAIAYDKELPKESHFNVWKNSDSGGEGGSALLAAMTTKEKKKKKFRKQILTSHDPQLDSMPASMTTIAPLRLCQLNDEEDDSMDDDLLQDADIKKDIEEDDPVFPSQKDIAAIKTEPAEGHQRVGGELVEANTDQTKSHQKNQLEVSRTVWIASSNGLGFRFDFRKLPSFPATAEIDQFLNCLLVQLYDMLIQHQSSVNDVGTVCSKEDCVGLAVYLDCWVDIRNAMNKALKLKSCGSHATFADFTAARFSDLLEVPTCSRKSHLSSIDHINSQDLLRYFVEENTSRGSKIFVKLLEAACRLRDAM